MIYQSDTIWHKNCVLDNDCLGYYSVAFDLFWCYLSLKIQSFLAQLARASCAGLSWKPRKCASCASARVVPKKQQSDGKYFSFPKRILFQCIWQLLMILCAAGEKKLSSSLTVDIFTIGICSFSSRIPNFSHILEGFSGVSGVRELCRILWLAKTRGCASCASARVVPEMTVTLWRPRAT